MRTPPVSAWRGEGGSRSGRPADVPLPPARLPLVRGGRPLKRWRWVGAFSADTMLCAAHATRRRRAGDVVGDLGRRAPARAHPAAPGRGADGARAGAGVAARPALRGGPGRRGRLAPRRAVHLDAQAGRHADPRDRCSAARSRATASSTTRPATTRATPPGAGRPASGSPSPARASRGTSSTACTTGRSTRSAPSGSTARRTTSARRPFADDLSAVGDLRCEAVAVRARRERMLVFASDYEQPFARFTRLAAASQGTSARAGVY